jgi:inhibitor of nuclear factor kappa-B kinase subunit alpha
MKILHEDALLIKNLYLLKGYGAKRLMKEFPNKGWKLGGVDSLLKKIRTTGSVDRQSGSGRPRSVRTDENVEMVESLVLSQEDKPKTHRSTRQISRETGIHRSSVHRIIHRDLQLKCLKRRRAQLLTENNRVARLTRCKQLLTRYDDSAVNFIWFSDEKVFTVEPPYNSQNDRVYAPVMTKKRDIDRSRLLRTRSTFGQSIMVSVAVSKLGVTELIFVDPGVKVNGQYYRDVVLSQQMLPAIKRVSGDMFVFQQDGAPAHRARDTIHLLQRETPDLIGPDLWPPNSPDLNPVDYKIWGVMQQRVYECRVNNLNELKQRLIDVWRGLQQTVIDTAVNEWRKRLRACVHAQGRQFEHLL